MRTRAELLAHVHNTNRQDHLPEIGQKLADKANRAGVAARFPEPAVQQSIAVALARLGHYDRLLTDRELSIVQPEGRRCANVYRLRSLPGVGQSLALVLR
jgi:hypothetical protein